MAQPYLLDDQSLRRQPIESGFNVWCSGSGTKAFIFGVYSRAKIPVRFQLQACGSQMGAKSLNASPAH